MIKPLPHSLELRAFLLSHSPKTHNGRFIDAIDDHIEKFDSFGEKWNKDSYYSVVGEPDDKGPTIAALGQVLDGDSFKLSYTSLTALRDGTTIEQTQAFFKAASGNLEGQLKRSTQMQEALDRGCFRSGSNRTLEDVLSTALSTRRLQQVLDATFGAGFGRLLKNDIIMLWTLYFTHVLLDDKITTKNLGDLIEIERKNPSIGLSGNVWSKWKN